MELVKEVEPKYYTYADYAGWDEDVRSELLDGEVVMMGTPSDRHQVVSGELFFRLRAFLGGKSCRVFAAPYSVRLFPQKNKRDNTVFEPDIVVICDQTKRDGNGCNGPPDMVIEIISPSSAKYDRVLKFRKYQQAGVREYWIVDPDINSVQVCILENGRYVTSVYDETDKAPVAVLEGCEIDLAGVFAE